MAPSPFLSLCSLSAHSSAPPTLSLLPCSYEPRYHQFKSEVLGSAASPDALAIAGGAGRSGSFEVSVTRSAEAKLVYSKLATGRFPDFAALAKQIVAGTV